MSTSYVNTLFDGWADYWDFAMGRMADDEIGEIEMQEYRPN